MIKTSSPSPAVAVAGAAILTIQQSTPAASSPEPDDRAPSSAVSWVENETGGPVSMVIKICFETVNFLRQNLRILLFLLNS